MVHSPTLICEIGLYIVSDNMVHSTLICEIGLNIVSDKMVHSTLICEIGLNIVSDHDCIKREGNHKEVIARCILDTEPQNDTYISNYH